MSVINLIATNGVFDIYCALSLLHVIDVPYLNKLYTELFIYRSSETIRMLSYVILINGVIRLSFKKHRCNILVVFSYILEAYIWSMEAGVYHTIDHNKAFYTFLIAMCMAYMSYYAK